MVDISSGERVFLIADALYFSSSVSCPLPILVIALHGMLAAFIYSIAKILLGFSSRGDFNYFVSRGRVGNSAFHFPGNFALHFWVFEQLGDFF